MVELYFASRLHVHSNNLILNIEKESHENIPHRIWTNIQKNRKISIPILSHWCTEFNFQSKPLKLRSIIGVHLKYPAYKPYEHVGNAYFTSNDKLRVCLLFLLPIFDSYLKYIEPLEKGPIKNYIQDFIHKRINYVECLFNRNLTPQRTINIGDFKFDLSNSWIDLDRFVSSSARINFHDFYYNQFKSASDKLKIRSDNLEDNEIISIILFKFAREKDRANTSGQSTQKNDVGKHIFYDGFSYQFTADLNEKFLVDINDIDNNFNRIAIHYKIHRV